MRALYTTLLYLSIPVILLRLSWRSLSAPAYRQRIMERFGFFTPPQTHQQGIWLHCVSVGETLAAKPLVEALLKHYPNLPLTITTTTPTGSHQVKALFGNRVFHVYMPYDLPDCIHRFLKKIQPKLFLVMETELWPNVLCACKNKNIKTILVNARLSQSSMQRYQKASTLTKNMMAMLNHILAQHSADAKRFIALGAKPTQIITTGNIKFDLNLPDNLAEQTKPWQKTLNERPCWIAASTHANEEHLILEAHQQILNTHASALLILVPRHPERFADVANLITTNGLNYIQRSKTNTIAEDTQVLLVDSMGELLTFYQLAHLAFVGGSLVEHGGHNPLEPAALAKPILFGPYTKNFATINAMLVEQNAAKQVMNTTMLAQNVTELLTNSDKRNNMGQAAKAVVAQNKGALEKTLSVIETMLVYSHHE